MALQYIAGPIAKILAHCSRRKNQVMQYCACPELGSTGHASCRAFVEQRMRFQRWLVRCYGGRVGATFTNEEADGGFAMKSTLPVS